MCYPFSPSHPVGTNRSPEANSGSHGAATFVQLDRELPARAPPQSTTLQNHPAVVKTAPAQVLLADLVVEAAFIAPLHSCLPHAGRLKEEAPLVSVPAKLSDERVLGGDSSETQATGDNRTFQHQVVEFRRADNVLTPAPDGNTMQIHYTELCNGQTFRTNASSSSHRSCRLPPSRAVDVAGIGKAGHS